MSTLIFGLFVDAGADGCGLPAVRGGAAAAGLGFAAGFGFGFAFG